MENTAAAYARHLRRVFSDYLDGTECKRLSHQVHTTIARGFVKTVAVLSQLPSEGKTFLVLTMALSHALQLKQRVLIVDAKNQPRGKGLYLDRLMGRVNSENPNFDSEIDPGVLDILTTRSQENCQISSTDFQLVPYLDSLKPRYDLILIDTCAMETAGKQNVDPLIIASQADAVILVTSKNSLRNGSLMQVKAELEHWQVRLLGLVHNQGATV